MPKAVAGPAPTSKKGTTEVYRPDGSKIDLIRGNDRQSACFPSSLVKKSGVKISKLPPMDRSALHSLAFSFYKVLSMEIENSPPINGGDERKANSTFYNYIPVRTDLGFIQFTHEGTPGETLRSMKLHDITYVSPVTGGERAICMGTGEYERITHMIAEHTEEYQYLREKQAILLEFLRVNPQFAQYLLEHFPTIKRYFYICDDASGGLEVFISRSCCIKCYNQADNLMVLCQYINLQKSAGLNMKGIHSAGITPDGSIHSFKSQILQFFSSLPLFHDKFMASIGHGDHMCSGLLFHHIHNRALSRVDATDTIGLIQGEPEVLLVTDDAIPWQGLATYAHNWFIENQHDYMEMAVLNIELSELYTLRTTMLAQGHAPDGTALEYRQYVDHVLSCHTDARFVRKLFKRAIKPSDSSSATSSEDELLSHPDETPSGRAVNAFTVRHRGACERSLRQFKRFVFSANNFELTDLIQFVSENHDQFMICTPDFWMALTKAINHSFHRTDGYNVVLIKATLTAIIMHDLRQFCLQMPDPEVSMRPWNILEIYQHNFFDFALHPDEHSAPDDAHSASSAQAAETMEESELLLDSAPDDVHSASSTPAAETMEESECLLGWDPDPPSDPDAPVCKF